MRSNGGVNDVAFLQRVFQSASKRLLGSNVRGWGNFVAPVAIGRHCAAFYLWFESELNG